MALIKCGKLDKNIIIPILGGIIKLIYNFLYDINPKEGMLKENPLIRNIYVSFGMVLSIIPFSILKIESNKNLIRKNDKNSEHIINKNKTKLNIKLIYYDIYKKQRYIKFKYILICSIFDFSHTVILILFCSKCAYNLWVLDIIIMTFFSFLILKSKIYNHHYLSIIIIIILGIALNIIEYFKKNDDEVQINAYEIFWKFISEISFSFAIIIAKYTMEKTFCTIYEICIWNGIITLILKIICLFIFNKMEITIADYKYPDNFFRYINNFNNFDLLMAFITNIYSFIYNIFIFFSCDYFTAFHTLIIIIIGEIYPYMKLDEKTILNIIGFIIILLILIIFLVFIEIIELNFCEFSKYTKKNITIRAKRDSELALTKIISMDSENGDGINPFNEE